VVVLSTTGGVVEAVSIVGTVVVPKVVEVVVELSVIRGVELLVVVVV
jgi:hypothetical protein